jgi:hypothetical protein
MTVATSSLPVPLSAGEQHRDVRGSDFADQIVDLLHRLGGTDQRTEAAELEERCAHGIELALELVRPSDAQQ